MSAEPSYYINYTQSCKALKANCGTTLKAKINTMHIFKASEAREIAKSFNDEKELIINEDRMTKIFSLIKKSSEAGCAGMHYWETITKAEISYLVKLGYDIAEKGMSILISWI